MYLDTQETEQAISQDGCQQSCHKCKGAFRVNKHKIIWDEKGYGYSTKLYQCPYCGAYTVLEYYEDSSLDLNINSKWYEY